MLQALLLSTVTALIIFVPFIIAGNGAFVVRDDYNVQTIPFTMAIQNYLSNGNPGGWCWNLDLGTSFIQGFSYYTIGSPWLWITLLFPNIPYIYIAGWIYITKYIVASLTAFLYLRLFIKDGSWAVAGSLLYAFSGFQCTNLMFGIFHDVVALFPLLMYGIEVLLTRGIKHIFIISCFLNCLCNYYFFIGEVIFLIMYFLFRFSESSIKDTLKKAAICLACGLLGVCMAAVLFLPNVLYILGGSRHQAKPFLQSIIWDAKGFLFLVKGLLLPGDTMHDHSAIMHGNWISAACYLPFVGIPPVIAYMNKKRDRLSLFLKLLLLLSFSPLLMSVFLLGAEYNYRWWYMMTLLMSLAAVKALNTPILHQEIFKCSIICAIIIVLFYAALKFLRFSAEENSLLYHPGRTFIFILISLSGFVFMNLCIRRAKQTCFFIISGICFFSVITGLLSMLLYRRGAETPERVKNLVTLGASLNEENPQYRFDTWENLLTCTGAASGIAGFSSTVSNSIRTFDDLFDSASTNFTTLKLDIEGIHSLLGARYRLTENPNDGRVTRIYREGQKTYYIIETNACPIGFSLDNYILHDDLMALDRNKRGIALLQAAVIEPSEEYLISPYAKRMTREQLHLEDSTDYLTGINLNHAVTDFSRNTAGFECKTSYVEDTIVYFSVPYENGWHAEIDGTSVQIISSGGMILLPVQKGSHHIQFSYITPGYRTGFVISAVSILLFVIISLKEIRYKKK